MKFSFGGFLLYLLVGLFFFHGAGVPLAFEDPYFYLKLLIWPVLLIVLILDWAGIEILISWK